MKVLRSLRPPLKHPSDGSGESEQRAIVRRLTESTRREGWRAAVLELRASYPRLFQYVADERASDWRFLLPEMPSGSMLCVGGALSPVPLVLAQTGTTVDVSCGRLEAAFTLARASEERARNLSAAAPPSQILSGLQGRTFDLVAGLRSAPGIRNGWHPRMLPGLARRVSPGGYLYLEIDRPAVLLSPARLGKRLERLGFQDVAFYWPKPSFAECEMLMPLGDPVLEQYYLDYVFFAMSARRKLLRAALQSAARLGFFEMTVPAYMAIAQRASTPAGDPGC